MAPLDVQGELSPKVTEGIRKSASSLIPSVSSRHLPLFTKGRLLQYETYVSLNFQECKLLLTHDSLGEPSLDFVYGLEGLLCRPLVLMIVFYGTASAVLWGDP